jgi:polyhydroxybutyrate depolymerase
LTRLREDLVRGADAAARRPRATRATVAALTISLLLATAAHATIAAAADVPTSPSTSSTGTTAPEAVAARPSKGCARPSLATGRRIEQTIDVAGVERSYVLDVPDTLKPGEPAALLFDFHGIGHSGGGVWQVSGFRALAPRERFITVYPDGLQVSFTRGDRNFSGPGWEIRTFDRNRDIDFTLAMLDRLEADYCIDRARVFSTGFSNGAYFSHVLGCTHADRFAAVAPVSGGWLGPWACKPPRAVPVLIQHGTEDDVIDVAEARRAHDAWLEIDACPKAASPASAADASGIGCTTSGACRDGAVVEYCEGPFAHRWPASATERVWTFLKAHPLPAGP